MYMILYFPDSRVLGRCYMCISQIHTSDMHVSHEVMYVYAYMISHNVLNILFFSRTIYIHLYVYIRDMEI